MKDYIYVLVIILLLLLLTGKNCDKKSVVEKEVEEYDCERVLLKEKIILDTVYIPTPVPYQVEVMDSATLKYYQDAIRVLSESLVNASIGDEIIGNRYQDTIRNEDYTFIYDIGVIGIMDRFYYHVQPHMRPVIREKKFGLGVFSEVNTAGIAGIGFIGIRKQDVLQVSIDTKKHWSLKYGRIWKF